MSLLIVRGLRGRDCLFVVVVVLSDSADEETKGWVGRQVQKLVNGTFHVIFKRLTVRTS